VAFSLLEVDVKESTMKLWPFLLLGLSFACGEPLRSSTGGGTGNSQPPNNMNGQAPNNPNLNNPSIYSQYHPPLKSPCEVIGSEVLLIMLKLQCNTKGPILTPRLGRDEWWGTKLPVSSHQVDDSGVMTSTNTVIYDYSKPYGEGGFAETKYRTDGNIETVSFPDLEAGGATITYFHYVYDNGTIVGSYADQNETPTPGSEIQSDVLYENGRRASEGLKNGPHSRRLHYRYDSNGRVIAILGGGSLNDLPQAPEADMLNRVCNGWTVPMISASGNPEDAYGYVGAAYFFRDNAGRITTKIEGWTPATPFYRTTYTYDGDRLVEVVTECAARAYQNHRIVYNYN